ncbi:HepT-like ribonuclease domain-containing protein [Crocosphaera chwakensis]|uniref:HepT-like ribonuclease domain-containing protein n=1 Tax=Crocosphaera chwakensis TaxID=2546361 RepID=UPI0009FB9AA2
MAGLRDVLIHDYLQVDIEEVWLIIVNELLQLKLTSCISTRKLNNYQKVINCE